VTPALADAGGLLVVVGHPDACRVAAVGLHGMQHRGRAGASVAVADGVRLRMVSGAGAVADALTDDALDRLVGGVALGCVHDGRGDGLVTGHSAAGSLVASVVGRFTNGMEVRQQLLEEGAVLRSGSDAELLLHLVARSDQRTFVNRLVDAVWRLEGAYALVVGTPERLVVLRDPHGVRPLWLGHLGDAVLFATDDVGIDAVGGRLARPLRPGEMVIVDDRGKQSMAPLPARQPAVCTQELLGLAPPAGRPFAEPVHSLRVRLGARLADSHPVPDAEVVVGLPGAGHEYAVGFSASTGQPLEVALSRPAPTPSVLRDRSGRLNRPMLGVVPSAVAHRTVALIMGPLTRGDRARQAVARLLGAGAAAVHVRCVAPPVQLACPYGLRIDGSEALAAVRHAEPEHLATWLGATSLAWSAASDLGEVLGEGRCEACMSMQLPIEVAARQRDDQLGLFDEGLG